MVIKIKAVIVEDEYLSLEELKYIIENNSNIEVIETFDNGIDVLNFINKNKVDVVFLDINIPGLNGMELTRTLKNFNVKPKIVFITAYKKYAVEAFELEVFDYITKPYLEERILQTLDRLKISDAALQVPDKPETKINDIVEKRIKLKEKHGFIVLDIDDIYMCEADDKETFVYTKDKKYVILDCISEIYKELPKDKFLKVHRSYVANLSKIKNIIPGGNSTYKLILDNKDLECWVSRGKIKEFREHMNM